MPPLNIEARYGNHWENKEICEPGGWGRLSDNKPEGGTNDYLFWCLDDSRSVVDCFEGGSYRIIGRGNIVASNDRLSHREILKGGEPYEITIRSGKNPAGRRVRFTHV
ncbi:MAG: hypothetical protein HY365_01270 [Candidatus Aenigmarchaeota archaeon]|nr:hypothetical protein [Candidatus Aenigmarchaeota archaeon]